MNFIFATHNDHKIQEAGKILSGLSIDITSLSALGYHDEIVENGATLDENAWIKANHIYNLFDDNVFAEDTGLEVDALGGAPGVHSARYTGSQRSDEANISKLLTLLEYHKDRSAQFRTVLAVWYNNKQYSFEGIVRGKIALVRSGKGGFGYDPVFIPDGYDHSFGELSSELKNSISHRGKAFNQLKQFLINV